MSISNRMVLEMDAKESGFSFSVSIDTALATAGLELANLEGVMSALDNIKPDCDKVDYILAASSGAVCGLVDIFLVGKPGDSSLGDLTDKWVADRVTDFAKLCGWNPEDQASALRYLEKKFKIPYDQTGRGIASEIFGLNPINHHFKSLAHNPTLLGLFFSILDQFTNQSHFVTEGELVALQDADGTFELHGKSVPAKVFSGFVNWLGHLISDVSGSSGSKGRGMGIPSPLLAWANDIIAIKRTLNIPVTDFDKGVCDLALNIYKQGFDARFLATQIIPVFVNETIVRLMYAIRRMIRYFHATTKDERSFKGMWSECKPFGNPTVKRMLTVSHGVFCMLDTGDAIIRAFTASAGTFNACEFFLRLNIVGVGRFGISLYGEARRPFLVYQAQENAEFASREKRIVNEYLAGLNKLTDMYDDERLVCFVDDFRNSNMYIDAFKRSAELARLRKVDEDDILKTKADIDNYFTGDE
jgi:hypothetical protein